MNKPNWKEAPEWANYLAQDADGAWYWYEDEPKIEGNQWIVESGRDDEADHSNLNWKETLEKRLE